VAVPLGDTASMTTITMMAVRTRPTHTGFGRVIAMAAAKVSTKDVKMTTER
jgi:hypothetical protein